MLAKCPQRFPCRPYFYFRVLERPHGSLQIFCSSWQGKPEYVLQLK